MDLESRKIYLRQVFLMYAIGKVQQRPEIGDSGMPQHAVQNNFAKIPHRQVYILKWVLIVVVEITCHLHSIPYRILLGLHAQGEESGFTKAVWDYSRDTEISFSAPW